MHLGQVSAFFCFILKIQRKTVENEKHFLSALSICLDYGMSCESKPQTAQTLYGTWDCMAHGCDIGCTFSRPRRESTPPHLEQSKQISFHNISRPWPCYLPKIHTHYLSSDMLVFSPILLIWMRSIGCREQNRNLVALFEECEILFLYSRCNPKVCV